jgi:hypothetical protein
MAIDFSNTPEGIYWAKGADGVWMVIEIKEERVFPVWPWYERYRYSLVPDQFILGEKITLPGPVKVWTSDGPKILEP